MYSVTEIIEPVNSQYHEGCTHFSLVTETGFSPPQASPLQRQRLGASPGFSRLSGAAMRHSFLQKVHDLRGDRAMFTLSNLLECRMQGPRQTHDQATLRHSTSFS